VNQDKEKTPAAQTASATGKTPALRRQIQRFLVTPAVLPVRNQDICDKRSQDIRDIG
jgi:hypothetical protein